MKPESSRPSLGLRVFAVCFLAAAGCPKPQVVMGPPVDAGALLEQVRAAHKVPRTLSCEAKAFVDAPENGGRYALQLSVKRPASLRIEALTPMGDPAAVLVADGGKFALLDLRNNVFYRGPATPRNLSRLLPAPLRDEELVALLTGAMPELPEALPEKANRVGDGYLLLVSTPRLAQEVSLGGDLRINDVRRLTSGGELLWAVHLDEHDDSSGAQVPRLLHLSAPKAKTEVDLRLKNVVVNKPPPAGAFLLGVPQGMKVEEVE
jgi:hypothetical protein